MSRIKLINLSLISAFVFCIILSMMGFADSCEEMQENIIRIRILANSDSESDQALKLQVRDAVLSASQNMYTDCDSYDDAIYLTEQNSVALLSAAEEALKSSGCDYDVTLDFREEFFETREYDGFTLPAGNYKTAVFTIGEGNGKNWWCVIFPRVCVGACSGRLEDSLSKGSAEVAYQSERYTVGFKTVEIFEKIKKFFHF